jgi:hypothetical protein
VTAASLFKVRVLPPDTEVTHVSSTLKTKVAAFSKVFVCISKVTRESILKETFVFTDVRT